jgi:outer membrane protein insertion porin family
MLAVLIVASPLLGQTAGPPGPSASAPAEPPDHAGDAVAAQGEETVVDVRITGNRNVPMTKIVAQVKTRAGRPFRLDVVQEDVRRLNQTKMFVNVRTYTRRVPEGVVVVFDVLERPLLHYVKYIGNVGVKAKKIKKETDLKAGDPLDPFAVEEARRKLESYYHEKGYGQARVTLLEGNRTDDQGAVFLINEGQKQRVLWTSFVGNTIASDSRLRTQIESKPGILWIFKGEVDRKKIDEDINKLTAYYRGLGFFRAHIGRELQFNEKENWLKLTFVIDEGPRHKIRNVSIIGNTKFNTEQLSEKLKLKRNDYFNQSSLQTDLLTMQDKYGAIGYIYADVKADPRILEEPGVIDLVYSISEGDRYRVGKIFVQIQGDPSRTKLTTVLNRLSLRPGDVIDTRELRASERRLQASGLFLADMAKGVKPKISFNPPDKEAEVARENGMKPKYRGQSPEPTPEDFQPIDAAPQQGDRLMNLTVEGTLVPSEQSAPSVQQASVQQASVQQTPVQQTPVQQASPAAWVEPVRARPVPAAVADDQQALPHVAYRAETERPAETVQPEPLIPREAWECLRGVQPAAAVCAEPAPSQAAPAPVARRAAPDMVVRYQYSAEGGYGMPTPPSRNASWSDSRSTASGASTQSTATSGTSTSNATGSSTTTTTQPSGSYYTSSTPSPSYGGTPSTAATTPGMVNATSQPVTEDGPVFDRPGDRDLTRPLDLNAEVRETETGRLMFGVGVNSDSGLVGQVVVDERNFDIAKWPTGWEDIRNGQAFRGAGQQFRIEAVPGTSVQRYMVSFREPYLLDTDISLGLSGYYYDRVYSEWTEQRVGGRISLGYQLTHDLSITGAYRGERVRISSLAALAPEYLAMEGSNALHGFQLSLAHDTRDSSFLPTEGHLIELSFEQVIGTFQYPTAELDMRKYFTMHQRPDGSGRHVLTLASRIGYKGPDTPVYDRFFAGGYSTLRGFSYRHASPLNLDYGVIVGGNAEVLASAEYMFPITADDVLRGVVFCDTGAIQPSFSDWRDNYRVSPGFGLRISIPALGPAPIALDFAFPISFQDGDRIENFSFFIGLGR